MKQESPDQIKQVFGADRRLKKLYESLEAVSSASSMYSINASKLAQFKRVFDFFDGFAEHNEGSIVNVSFKPDDKSARFVTESFMLEAMRDEIPPFANILKDIDIMNIEIVNDIDVRIEIGICDVLEKL